MPKGPAATTTPWALPCGWPAAASRGASASARPTSSARAAVEEPLHVRRLHATILHQMGIDPNRLSYFFGGLDQKLVGVEHVEPIAPAHLERNSSFKCRGVTLPCDLAHCRGSGLLLACRCPPTLRRLRAAEPPAVSTGKPHRVLIGDYSKHIIAIVDADGRNRVVGADPRHPRRLAAAGRQRAVSDRLANHRRNDPRGRGSLALRRRQQQRQCRQAGRSARLSAIAQWPDDDRRKRARPDHRSRPRRAHRKKRSS